MNKPISMKNSILALVTILCTITFVKSQNCSKYYAFDEGAESELTIYNAKGKVESILVYKVLSTNNSEGITTATMSTQMKDKKGNSLTSTEFTATCTGGIVSIDFESLMNSESLQSFGEMEYDVTGTNLDLPNDLSIGQNLNDAEILITLKKSGMTMTMGTQITDRKVVNQETITTPAGTYDCYVIKHTNKVTSMMGFGGRQWNSKTWVSEGVGVVKTEEYNKRDKLDSFSLLTSFTK